MPRLRRALSTLVDGFGGAGLGLEGRGLALGVDLVCVGCYVQLELEGGSMGSRGKGTRCDTAAATASVMGS